MQVGDLLKLRAEAPANQEEDLAQRFIAAASEYAIHIGICKEVRD
jgi:hypothetical protein